MVIKPWPPTLATTRAGRPRIASPPSAGASPGTTAARDRTRLRGRDRHVAPAQQNVPSRGPTLTSRHDTARGGGVSVGAGGF
ncbi:hypothetical protein ABIA33_000391 [Streptacidiphilus sp. MAP12-16]